MTTTWRNKITQEMDRRDDGWDNVVGMSSGSSEWLNANYVGGYGTVCGPPFGVWTADYVYFPCAYDGLEWVGSVPRTPQDNPILHIGEGKNALASEWPDTPGPGWRGVIRGPDQQR